MSSSRFREGVETRLRNSVARWAFATCALLIAGCAGNRGPNGLDLDEIYSRSAKDHGPFRNPVIIIPWLNAYIRCRVTRSFP